jgi:pyruvate-ferredoxin/flavodoxin oxidoreductase
MAKKDLARIAMTYGSVYVANVAMGAKDEHTVRSFIEAEKFNGPSLIIAYSHCIAHGIDMQGGFEQQKLAVQTGYWPLFRYNPDLLKEGKNPLQLDSAAPKMPLKEYAYRENRFVMLSKSMPERAQALIEQAQEDVNTRWEIYQHLAAQAMARAGEQA